MKRRGVFAGIAAVVAVGAGVFGWSRAYSQGEERITGAPPYPYDFAEVQIPGGQQFGTQGTFSTASSSFVPVPTAVTINNTTGKTQNVLLRWTGHAHHNDTGGYHLVAPMRDGVALPSTPGAWYLAYDFDNSGNEWDYFAVQWTVPVGTGLHTFQPALASNVGGQARYINEYHFTAEMKTK